MIRTALVAFVVFLTACESNEDRSARYQTAHIQCSKIASATARAEPGLFGRKHEGITAAALNGCLSARGFESEVAASHKTREREMSTK
jgi:hypothetical protein